MPTIITNPPLLINGGHHAGDQLRRMLRDLARGNEGVLFADSFTVSQLTAATDQVEISPGSAFVRGKDSTLQGTYWADEVTTKTVDITPTGGTPRSDMVVLRIKDPLYVGGLGPDGLTLNPDTNVAYFDIIENVASTATVVTSITAIPLARIDLPASTAAVTDAMITDLRRVANPRESRFLKRLPGGTGSAEGLGSLIAPGDFFWWPDATNASVYIPAWATKMFVVMRVDGFKLTGGDWGGYFRVDIGNGALFSASTWWRHATPSTTDRYAIVCADDLVVPSGMRGTAQPFRMTGNQDAGDEAADVIADGITYGYLDVSFTEGPIF